MIDYLPWFEDTDGRKWDVLSLNFCVDWGGRQCQIEAQTQDGDKYSTKSFVVYYLGEVFAQWDSEEYTSVTPVKGMLYECVMQMFNTFDVKE